MWLISLIREPYPFHSIRQEFKTAIIFAFFVFGFLTFFQPFGLGGDWTSLIKITSVYGFITFFSIILTHLLFRLFFPTVFSEKNWVFGKELMSTLIMFSIIGCVNLVYTNFRFGLSLTFSNFLWFQLNTFAVGFFPVVFFMLINYARLLKVNTANARQLSINFKQKPEQTDHTQVEYLTIKSELKSDDLTLNWNDFLFAEAADNYVAVSYLESGLLQKKLIRTTLAKLEPEITPFRSIIRSHRAFIVNLDHVESFRGNAQGLQLKLKWNATEVPVSRKMVSAIKNHFI